MNYAISTAIKNQKNEYKSSNYSGGRKRRREKGREGRKQREEVRERGRKKESLNTANS